MRGRELNDLEFAVSKAHHGWIGRGQARSSDAVNQFELIWRPILNHTQPGELPRKQGLRHPAVPVISVNFNLNALDEIRDRAHEYTRLRRCLPGSERATSGLWDGQPRGRRNKRRRKLLLRPDTRPRSGREPPSYIDLQLRVRVSYRNAGTRPLILPLERERIIYYGLKPESMSAFRDNGGLFEPVVKPMKELPADVSRDSPVSPGNGVFTVIPAGGEMPLLEEITLPVNRTGFFRRYLDLRGYRVYIKLQFAHRELSPALKADLSDRWSPYGVTWTGILTTNTFVVDVPAAPSAVALCIDPEPAQPVSGHGLPVQSGK